MKENEVEYRGVAFEHGRKHWIVPPIDTVQAEKLGGLLDDATNKDIDYHQRRLFMLAVIQTAMSRNYQEIPEVELDENGKPKEIAVVIKKFVTLSNIGDVYAAAIGVNDAKYPKVLEPPVERPPEIVVPPDRLVM